MTVRSIILARMKESDTKRKLLETALDLIWESSYGAVSVNDICARAGVKKGSFYHFFPSKSALAVAAYERHWEESRGRLDRVFSAQTGPLERLANYCDLVYQRQKERQERIGKVCGCPYSSVAAEQSTQDEQIREKSSQIFARMCKYFEGALRDAAHAGLIEQQDHRERARELSSYVNGMLLEAKINNDVEILKALKSGVFRIIGAAEQRVPVADIVS